ncbi:MAG TPA: GNAT family N-acetyltransferase [bacterium]|nr:GNAT family N-acetyltransferase [bacterium]
MTFPLITPRLQLRPPTVDDFEELYAIIWSDPAVMRFVADGQTRSRERAWTGFEKMLAIYNERRMGPLMIVEATNGRLAGECGVMPVPGADGDIELFYTLGKDFWGRGLATEAARAVLAYAMSPMEDGGLGLDRLIGITYPNNLASQRVLSKIGMRQVGLTDKFYDIQSVWFVIER